MHKTLLLTAAAAVLALPASTWCQQNESQPAAPSGQNQPAAQAAQAPQQDSLAEAARKAREQKKDAPKPAKTFTNDNLPSDGGISTVGDNSGTASGDNSAATDTSKTPADEKSWRARFATLNHKLEQDQANLDVMQRELSQLQVQYYPDPMKAMQQEFTRSDINKKTADIDKAQAQIAADKQAIADAEDELRKSGGDPGWAR